MLKHVYLLLKQRLEEIGELKEVDWYTGQYSQDGEQTMYVPDAAYIEFDPLSFDQLGKRTQSADLSFSVHFVQDCVLDGERRMTDATLNHLGLVQDIYKKLSHWEAMLSGLSEFAALLDTPGDIKVINSIVRTRLSPDHSLKNLLVTVQSFRFPYKDLSATPEYQQVLAQLNLTANIQNP
jgi:hypothetical protein